ncbi:MULTISPECIES: LPS export ABC transporter periplasmic protein LptC [Sphingomonadaceae]|uniref:LPS export ABC transporter periplasmic protein LptC n=1 Tax=Sphingomonadaceae TaxID=41297 RepID=UPI00115AC7AF|nr:MULTISPECIES: LPS export ABC transporter periplasmic protein LptC [Sphingomonadaceae]QDK34189.1 LPS export ABC transporter periplasmic protein LptC [Sphingomonas sp. IC081]QSR17001.1 LPS export ABC transporter periplasmic protein LptC [Novosphingobium sp. KA1]
MSEDAIQIRNRRRHFAAPGGSHDRLVGFLAKALPTGIGLIAAVMILVPLSPRGEISFLLDRNKVAVTGERVAVSNAAYRGQDKAGRDFLVTAGTAVQHAPDVPVVEMLDLVAKMNMKDGPANIAAPRGAYNFDADTMKVDGPVNFQGAGGYNMTTSQVNIDIKQKTAVATGGVSGAVPNGTFTAQTMHADLDNRVVTLEGNARMRMTPGKLRIPQ